MNLSARTWAKASTWTGHEHLTPRVGQFTIYHVCHSWTAPLQALPGRGYTRPSTTIEPAVRHDVGGITYWGEFAGFATSRAGWNLFSEGVRSR